MEIRLAGATVNYKGRVEISYNGIWGTVCDSNWSKFDATVLCRQLGFEEGNTDNWADYGTGTGPVYMDSLKCDSSESSILQCDNAGWNNAGRHCSNHKTDAKAKCEGPGMFVLYTNLYIDCSLSSFFEK